MQPDGILVSGEGQPSESIGQKAGKRFWLVQKADNAWNDAVHRCFCREFERCGRETGVSESMQRQLSAPDAVSGYAEGKK